MSYGDFPFHNPDEENTRRVSWLAVLFAVPFLLLAMVPVINQKAAHANANIREGMHDVLGRPDETYSLIASTAILFATPGVILFVRAFFKPSILQVFATLVGGCMTSMVLVNILFGKLDSGLTFIAAVAFLAFVIDVYLYQRERTLYG